VASKSSSVKGAGPFMLAVVISVLVPVTVLAAGASELPLALVALTSPVSHGNAASISVKTAPGAACMITVIYKSGPSRAKGLTSKTADNRGMVSWTWIVGTRTTPGKWPISVSCSGGGKHGTLETSIVVT
jgi:hypothetical protein